MKNSYFVFIVFVGLVSLTLFAVASSLSGAQDLVDRRSRLSDVLAEISDTKNERILGREPRELPEEKEKKTFEKKAQDHIKLDALKLQKTEKNQDEKVEDNTDSKSRLDAILSRIRGEKTTSKSIGTKNEDQRIEEHVRSEKKKFDSRKVRLLIDKYDRKQKEIKQNIRELVTQRSKARALRLKMEQVLGSRSTRFDTQKESAQEKAKSLLSRASKIIGKVEKRLLQEIDDVKKNIKEATGD